MPYGYNEDVETGAGLVGVCIPNSMSNLDMTRIVATHHDAGTDGTTVINIRRRRGTTSNWVLSTSLTIEANEVSSISSSIPYVFNPSYDDLNEGDLIFVDIFEVSTGAKGLSITISAT